MDEKEQREIEKRQKRGVIHPEKWTLEEILKKYRVRGKAKSNFDYLEEMVRRNWGSQANTDRKYLIDWIAGNRNKVIQIPHYLSGDDQWIMTYWMSGSFQQLCRIQLKPPQTLLTTIGRIPNQKTTRPKDSFLVVLPVSASIGKAICQSDLVSKPIKNVIKSTISDGDKIGFVTLTVRTREDCDSIIAALKVVIEQYKLHAHA